MKEAKKLSFAAKLRLTINAIELHFWPWLAITPRFFALGRCTVAHPLLLYRADTRGKKLVGGIEK